jgi:hypothetical protein
MRSLSWGRRGRTPTRPDACPTSSSSISPSSTPVSALVAVDGDAELTGDGAGGVDVVAGDHDHPDAGVWQAAIDSFTPARGGSIMPCSPRKTRPGFGDLGASGTRLGSSTVGEREDPQSSGRQLAAASCT